MIAFARLVALIFFIKGIADATHSPSRKSLSRSVIKPGLYIVVCCIFCSITPASASPFTFRYRKNEPTFAPYDETNP